MVKVKPRHFKTTLVFLFSLFLAIAMAIFTAHSINTETDRIATSLESQALALTSNLAATGADHVLARDFTSIELMLLRSAQFEGVRLITVADAEGKILSTIKTEPGKGSLPLYGQEPITVPAGKKPIVLREESKITIWHPMLLGKVVGWVRVEFGLEVITRVTNKYLIENFIYGMAILSIVSFILVYFLRKPAVAIEKYTEFADGLEMNLGRNIDVDQSSVEFKKLGEALNRASKKLSDQASQINKAVINLERLAAFPEMNPNIVLSVNYQRKLEYLNPHGKKIMHWFNLKEEEFEKLLPQDLDRIYHDCFVLGKTLYGLESKIEQMSLLWTFAPVANQEIVHAYASDITERKRALEQANTAEQNRLQAESANQSKSAFLANMSHEIRTPLTAIIGFAESLLEKDQSESERLDATMTIIRSGKHLQSIISNILDLSKIEASKLEIEQIDVPLIELINEIIPMIEILAQEKGLLFSVNYKYPIPEVIVTDPVRLKQILINLCNNAVKFTEIGGVELRVSYDDHYDDMIFSVLDSGIGLNSSQIGRIFNAFSQADSTTTRKYGGTGLGLSLSRNLAVMLGGDISVESEFGVGSVFTATIKAGTTGATRFLRETPIPQAERDIKSTQEHRVYRGKVLLAEDNADNQRFIGLKLRRLGIKTTIANNGKEAVDLALSGQFDLILMDNQMPELNGLDATKKLREQGYTAPIVFLTANATREDQLKSETAGCDDFLTKPIEWKSVYKVFDRYLTKNILEVSNNDTSNASGEQLVPILSELECSDPELYEMVVRFVHSLPSKLEDLHNYYKKKDVENLLDFLHQFKAVSGNYGFSEMQTIAEAMEKLASESIWDSFPENLEELKILSDRMAAGIQKQ